MADVRIVHQMPVFEYGSVKKSLEEWYDHLMICPISSLSFQRCFYRRKVNLKINFMEKIHEHAAGIDIGSRKIYVGLEGKEVVSFETFTSDFVKASDYLKKNNIKTVAMEATGVYWVVLYDILTQAGFDVWLVDGRQTKQVPGRKTDVNGYNNCIVMVY